MKQSLKPFLFICFISMLNVSFSQNDKEKILLNFDYIEYYLDSTIKEARKFSGASLEGITVEFNVAGEPVAIGNYKKGMKTGKWIYSDGTTDFFPEQKEDLELHVDLTENYDQEGNKTGLIIPGCGTGKHLLMREFYQNYFTLLNLENKKRHSCWSPKTDWSFPDAWILPGVWRKDSLTFSFIQLQLKN